MQITLNHEEIVAALEAHARKLINIAPGNTLQIELKAGRGENGYSATLDIVPDTVVSIQSAQTATKSAQPVEEVKTAAVREVAQKVVDEPVGVEAEPELPDDDDAMVDEFINDNQKRTSLFAREPQ
ncbi:MAG: hypothetical protein ACRDCE_08370 [Cetobacterium sp.]|uniref:hypothetical protein n=1 Tax=Cetobacterium sp. TaxID=2071632 RepID=UPI003EE5FD52